MLLKSMCLRLRCSTWLRWNFSIPFMDWLFPLTVSILPPKQKKLGRQSQSWGAYINVGKTCVVFMKSLVNNTQLRHIPWWFSGKESACNAGDLCLMPGSGKSPGEGNGNPLQYSCLADSMDRGVWHAAVHGVAKSLTRLNNWTELN